MAEEWGHVIIQTSDELMNDIKTTENGDAIDVVRRLMKIAKIDGETLDDVDCRIGTVVLKSGYALFDYDCFDWSRISKTLVGKGSGIEYYCYRR